MNKLREKLRIADESVRKINDFILDPDNPLVSSLLKIIDKYGIVESVWGESYIDEVDDARIEKLVSRLRQKIEPDAEQPRYLTTIRGRGYKLVGAE